MTTAGHPFYRDIFRFSGRRARLSYLKYSACWHVLLLPVYAMREVYGESRVVLIIFLCIVFVALTSSLLVAAQRCRDFGWRGWLVAIMPIPVVGMLLYIALFFIPGTRGPNRYGPDPRDAQPST